MNFLTSILITLFVGLSNLTGTIGDLYTYHTAIIPEYQYTSINKQSSPTLVESQFKSPHNLLESLRDNISYQQALVTEALPAQTPPTEEILETLVTIQCSYTTNDGNRQTTSGSGTVINEEGIVLTSAHVAQYMLLSNTTYNSDCTITSNTDGTPEYQGTVLYISPAWLAHNVSKLEETNPQGTGERDYALLILSKDSAATEDPTFPYLSIVEEEITVDVYRNPVTVAGFPTTPEWYTQETDRLSAIVDQSRVAKLYTFGDGLIDLLGLTGTTLGERGASGGPVISQTGEIIALIASRDDDEDLGTGSLRAITITHIKHTLESESGASLSTHLAPGYETRAELFNQTIQEALLPGN